MKTTLLTGLVLAGLGAFGCSSACGKEGGTVRDRDALADRFQDAGRDATQDSAQPDAKPDASIPDGAPPHQDEDFCDQPMTFFPLEGGTGGTLDLSDRWLAFAWIDPRGATGLKVYDLEHCLRYDVAPGWWHFYRDWGLDLGHDDLVVSTKPSSFVSTDIYHMDLGTWTLTRLTESEDLTEESPVTNGRYLVYAERNYLADPNGRDVDHGLWLFDMETNSATILAQPNTEASTWDISERYVAWIAYPQEAGSYHKDAFFYDLQTGQTLHIEQTKPVAPSLIRTAGDYILWMESDMVSTPPYRIVEYDISTNVRRVLNEEIPLRGFTVGAKYFLWDTFQYRTADDGLGSGARDIVAYDPVTHTERRLTTRPAYWGTGKFHTPKRWAQFQEIYGGNEYGLYLIDLQAYGILNQDGNLIPGDPVIEPPGQ